MTRLVYIQHKTLLKLYLKKEKKKMMSTCEIYMEFLY